MHRSDLVFFLRRNKSLAAKEVEATVSSTYKDPVAGVLSSYGCDLKHNFAIWQGYGLFSAFRGVRT
jgi:hypothetical protein